MATQSAKMFWACGEEQYFIRHAVEGCARAGRRGRVRDADLHPAPAANIHGEVKLCTSRACRGRYSDAQRQQLAAGWDARVAAAELDRPTFARAWAEHTALARQSATLTRAGVELEPLPDIDWEARALAELSCAAGETYRSPEVPWDRFAAALADGDDAAAGLLAHMGEAGETATLTAGFDKVWRWDWRDDLPGGAQPDLWEEAAIGRAGLGTAAALLGTRGITPNPDGGPFAHRRVTVGLLAAVLACELAALTRAFYVSRIDFGGPAGAAMSALLCEQDPLWLWDRAGLLTTRRLPLISAALAVAG